MQAPDWCAKRWPAYSRSIGNQHYMWAFFYHCENVSENVQYSGFPTLSPLVAGLTNIICLVILMVSRVYKFKWVKNSKNARRRTYAIAVILILCIMDEVYAISAGKYPHLANFAKPVIILIFLRSVRHTFIQIL